jgi:hypothetical protein
MASEAFERDPWSGCHVKKDINGMKWLLKPFHGSF